MRYIELNPVRADMVAHPSEYPWSSYHHNALGQPDGLLTPHLEYRRLGKTDEARQAAYRQLFKHHIPEELKGPGSNYSSNVIHNSNSP